MRGSVLTVAAVLALWAVPSAAQVDGLLTPYVGVVGGGDLAEAGATFGLTLAALRPNGLGAEVDIGHGSGFDAARFEKSGLTSLMANFLTALPRGRVRPFGVIGLGLLRVRGCGVDCVRLLSRTDLAASLGGGVAVPVTTLFAIRGDLRYLRYLQHHSGLPRLDSGPFDFWRWSVGLTYNWPLGPHD